MDDREREYEALRRMTPEQKLAIMHTLIHQAYELKAAGLRWAHPDWSEEEIWKRTCEMVAAADEPDLMRFVPVRGLQETEESGTPDTRSATE